MVTIEGASLIINAVYLHSDITLSLSLSTMFLYAEGSLREDGGFWHSIADSSRFEGAVRRLAMSSMLYERIVSLETTHRTLSDPMI